MGEYVTEILDIDLVAKAYWRAGAPDLRGLYAIHPDNLAVADGDEDQDKDLFLGVMDEKVVTGFISNFHNLELATINGEEVVVVDEHHKMIIPRTQE